jgi:hypothetical protein
MSLEKFSTFGRTSCDLSELRGILVEIVRGGSQGISDVTY